MALGAPLTAAASDGGSTRTGSAAAPDAVRGLDPVATMAASLGVIYAGVTPQGWPVMVELSRDGRKLVRAYIGLSYKCTNGAWNEADFVTKLTLRNGRFSGSYGPFDQKYDDGTSRTWEGSLSFALNRARTTMSGAWRTKFTDKDASGAVTDTCDSGTVRWKAKQ